MKAGIVGLPNVGKSTLFNALTATGKAEASNYPFCTIEPNVGIVPVPDPRLETIKEYIDSKQVIPAVLQLVDIAGLVRGASEGEGLGNKFLSHIREVDAILHVVRCFEDEDVSHIDGTVDAIRDVETIETELMLADLQQIESSLDRASRVARTGDKESKTRVEILTKCRDAVAKGHPVRTVEIEDPEHQKLLSNMGLLSSKRILYVANVHENSQQEDGDQVRKIREYALAHGGGVVMVCAKIEAELIELEAADRLEMLASLGMDEPALHKVARAAYALLGLQSFFTAGPKEIRAWTIREGATAPQAAGVIHTDFERGFIRMETYSVADLEVHGSEAAIRSVGKLRVEGKSYVVQDGDICHILFNV